MVKIPEGFERVTPPPKATSTGPTLPPGFEREPPTRPQMPVTGTAEQFGQNLVNLVNTGASTVGNIASDQLPVTATHYQNLAHFGGFLGLPSLADLAGKVGITIPEPTSDEQARYRDEVISGIISAAAGMLGRAFGAKIGDALKYLGRGGRTVPGTQRFLAQNAPYVTAQGASRGSLLAPPLSGAAVTELLDRTDVLGFQPHEPAGDTAAITAGAGTTALVTKNTLDDLLLGNQRWRDLVTRPSSGAASGVLGAVLGYLASRGMLAGKDQINDAIDYVASLFGGEEDQTK